MQLLDDFENRFNNLRLIQTKFNFSLPGAFPG